MTIQYDPDITDSGPMKALQMYDQEKLTQAEIAQRLDVAQSTVSIWIQKARRDIENGQGNIREMRPRARTREIDYHVIIKDLILIVFAVCAVIATIDFTHLSWLHP